MYLRLGDYVIAICVSTFVCDVKGAHLLVNTNMVVAGPNGGEQTAGNGCLPTVATTTPPQSSPTKDKSRGEQTLPKKEKNCDSELFKVHWVPVVSSALGPGKN